MLSRRISVLLLAALALVVGVSGQGVGTFTAEFHPSLTTQTCTSAGCTDVGTSITIDANWRWVHNSAGTNCYTGNTWNTEICPDPTTCTASCAVEGVAQSGYTGTYGITTSGSDITLGFVTGANIGSRVYLLEDTDTYQVFMLKNREFAFDVDVSNLPCGLNGALYFVEMDSDGGLSKYPGNKAGAQYGTGYCDAQCPQDLKFIDGEANVIDWTPSATDPNSGTGFYGTCCIELDIWEANSISHATTPHPCNVTGQTQCNGTLCGEGSERYDGVCDKDGCDYNPFRMGNQTFFGPGMIVDSTKPMTVVTQFITSDGTDSGDLVEIKRLFVQNGVVFENSYGNFAGVSTFNSITDDFCTAQKTLFGDPDQFTAKGGLATMSAAMDRGLVLVMSLWDDFQAECLWLDSNYPTTSAASKPGVARGTCPITSGVPAQVQAEYPSSSVTWSNIKVGNLGTTTTGVSAPSSSGSAPTNAPTSAPTTAATSAPTKAPTSAPTTAPTSAPTKAPTSAPTTAPTSAPTKAPTQAPTSAPTKAPTKAPTTAPTAAPTKAPTSAPTSTPTKNPTSAPTSSPSCGACGASSIQITQSLMNSWPQGTDTINQYSVSVSTTCTNQVLKSLTLQTTNWNVQQGGYWGFTVSGETVTLPSYIAISASSPLTQGLGYQNIGGQASFSVLSYTFVDM